MTAAIRTTTAQLIPLLRYMVRPSTPRRFMPHRPSMRLRSLDLALVTVPVGGMAMEAAGKVTVAEAAGKVTVAEAVGKVTVAEAVGAAAPCRRRVMGVAAGVGVSP